MTENKTKPTSMSVPNFLASRANAQQHKDCKTLMALFKKITKQSPKMWGPSIVGYGSFRYTYASGHSGESPLAAFAIRGRDLVVYFDPETGARKSIRATLGKYSMGKSCLYFRQLADLDAAVLEQLVVESIAAVRQRYQTR